MRKVNLLKKSGVVGIIIIFICASFVSSIGGYSEDVSQVDTDVADVCEVKEDVLVACSTFGFPGEPSQETSMSQSDAEFLYEKIKELQIEIARDPLSEKTQQLQHEIITLADEHNLLPAGLSVKTLKSRLTPTLHPQHPRITLPRLQNKASEMFCNYVSTGSGSALPIIILPRLIPILLTPIPRLFVRWSTMDGVTSCGGLRSGTGFIAYGAQNGIALGFWGIGFSIFLPPVMAYGLFGYALFASVNAEEIELWPPNYPPEVTVISPPKGAENVPVSTSELTFQIKDYNEDLMNYTVTTNPNIGSGSGDNKPDGTYSVPISGLEGTEEYTWHIQVNDGVNEVDVSSSFTTEAVAPIVSNPIPEDGARYVPFDLSQLSFHLSDPQGDLMDYTVETSPDIGSGSVSGVGEGTYSIDVSSLDNLTDYIWYVNVTDGTNWKHKFFGFQTEPKMVFNPFDEGWQYRKKITIDHTQVAGDLTNFPVLVSTVDTDLHDKTQDDGDDILFMNGDGVATRLYHEIEHYDDSSGELVAWVNLTDITADQDTTFYMYYGNSGCSSQQVTEKVWESNYKAVWHLHESPTGTIHDSTKNDNDGSSYGSMTSSDLTDGKVGKCINFDGNDDYISVPDSNSLKPESVSLQTWFKRQENNPDPGYFLVKASYDIWGNADGRTYGFNLSVMEDDIYGSFERDAAKPQREGLGPYYSSIETWYHLTLTYDLSSSSGYFYVNGEIYDFGNGYHPSVLWYNKPWDFIMGGSRGHAGSSKEINHWFNCCIDEVRISCISLSEDWIKTEYNNQNNPASFLSFGPEETGP